VLSKLTLECRGETVKRNDNDECGDRAGERRAHTGLGLEGRTREGAGGWVRAEDGADRVGNANSNQLLIRVNLVSIDTAECYRASCQR
jgi:hypothetical protein